MLTVIRKNAHKEKTPNMRVKCKTAKLGEQGSERRGPLPPS